MERCTTCLISVGSDLEGKTIPSLCHEGDFEGSEGLADQMTAVIRVHEGNYILRGCQAGRDLWKRTSLVGGISAYPFSRDHKTEVRSRRKKGFYILRM